LEKMKVDLGGGASSDDDTTDPNRDAFGQKSLEYNRLAKELREETSRLAEMRSRVPDGRSKETIELASANDKKLKQCAKLWEDMKTQVIKDAKKKKVDEKELTRRKELVTAYADEIKQLSEGNLHTRAAPTSENQKRLDSARQERLKQRQAKAEKRAKDRRSKAEAKGEKYDENQIDADDIEMKEQQPQSAQVQAFQEEAQDAIREQDELLDQVLHGMKELKDMAINIGVGLDTGAKLADELGTVVDNANAKLKKSNDRLEAILEESGGMTRWCPMLICMILLLALLGYMYNMLTS